MGAMQLEPPPAPKSGGGNGDGNTVTLTIQEYTELLAAKAELPIVTKKIAEASKQLDQSLQREKQAYQDGEDKAMKMYKQFKGIPATPKATPNK